MGTGGNGKPPKWEWELPALPCGSVLRTLKTGNVFWWYAKQNRVGVVKSWADECTCYGLRCVLGDGRANVTHSPDVVIRRLTDCSLTNVKCLFSVTPRILTWPANGIVERATQKKTISPQICCCTTLWNFSVQLNQLYNCSFVSAYG